MGPMWQTVTLLFQAAVYFVIWFLYGYGSEALRKRDSWELAKKIFDVAGNEIPLGWSLIDRIMGTLGFAVIMPLPWISAVYLILANFFPALPVPANKSLLIPLFFAIICIPLGPALVNGGAFYSRFNSTPPATIQKLREASKSGSVVTCALVSYDPESTTDEMDQCVAEVETAKNPKEKRERIEQFFRDGKIRKVIQPAESMSILRAIIEGYRDNWLFIRNFGDDPNYNLESDLREREFLLSRSNHVMSVVPVYRQIWFIDNYTELLLQKEHYFSSMTHIARFAINMETGWSEEAKEYFNKNILPKLKEKFRSALEDYKTFNPADFSGNSRSWIKKVTDGLSNIMNSF